MTRIQSDTVKFSYFCCVKNLICRENNFACKDRETYEWCAIRRCTRKFPLARLFRTVFISPNITKTYYIFTPASWRNFQHHFFPVIFFHHIFCNVFLHRLLIYPRIPFVVEGAWNHLTYYATLLYEKLRVDSKYCKWMVWRVYISRRKKILFWKKIS